jgi:hypothetical protein
MEACGLVEGRILQTGRRRRWMFSSCPASYLNGALTGRDRVIGKSRYSPLDAAAEQVSPAGSRSCAAPAAMSSRSVRVMKNWNPSFE